MCLCDIRKVGIPCTGTSPVHVDQSERARARPSTRVRLYGIRRQRCTGQVTGLHEINNVTKEVISAYGFINKAQFDAGFETDRLKLKDGAVTAVMIPVMSRNRRCPTNPDTRAAGALVRQPGPSSPTAVPLLPSFSLCSYQS
ncbi:hypothetical protein DPX16_19815 [Anabarilius grahami]|uniref:Uncharacterized protein n=1 Tax=Anabarilius grahami TaxID=495550 RepID=A0A3N0Y6X5_ANAGA|nr:hypothetical protein DPX16_19815 [Anabarilius grahami]